METRRVCPHLAEMIYGGDYNPEQWPETVWKEDVELMQQAGVNLVSVGIFSWAKLNPAPGVFVFDWLDRVMDLLAEGGIRVNLATATASPPAWLGRLHPEIRPVDIDGSTFSHGGRQAFTPNAPAFEEHALALVRALAEHYTGHPALVMWHVNNEYHGNGPVSYGELDAAAFRVWLQHRYGSLEALNEAWGTAFWSQWYYEWEEVVPPRKVPAGPNPSMQLDYARFFSDAYIELFRKEAAILRERTPDIPVTTNFPHLLTRLDLFKLVEVADFAAMDAYPDPLVDELPGFAADLTRGTKPGRSWVLMEQVTSQIQWRPVNPLKRPGVMRLWSFSNIARGSDGIMFFQWRQGRFGGEKFHAAMVPAAGTDNSRVWREVCQLGADLKKLRAVVGSWTEARVAILYSFEILWALDAPGKPATFDYEGEAQRLYRALWELGVTVDFVHPDKLEAGSYAAVLVPVGYMLTQGQATHISRYIESGGQVLMTYFSSLVDGHDHLSTSGFPAHLQDVFGVEVEEWDALPEGAGNRLRFLETDARIETDFLCEVVQAEDAHVVAVHEEDFYAGKPALTRRSHGAGQAWYLAARPAKTSGWKAVLSAFLTPAILEDILPVPEGVERVVRRQEDGTRFLFLMNYRKEAVELDLGRHAGVDLLSGEALADSCTLDPHGVRVLQLPPSGPS